MALNFCYACGARLEPDSRFCSSCGAVLIEAAQVETVGESQVEAAVPVTVQTTPQAAAQPAVKMHRGEQIQKAASGVKQIAELLGNSVYADAGSGEMTFAQPFSLPKTQLTEAIGPFKYLWRSLTRLLKGFKEALHDKKKWIPLLLLIVIWIAVPVLKYFKMLNLPIYYLSMVTFADNSLRNGTTGLIGDFFGKAFVASFLTQFISTTFALKNPFSGAGRSLAGFFRSFKMAHFNSYAPLLMGVGIALILYNFMGSYIRPQTVVIAVSGFVLSMKAIGSQAGFIKGFFASLTGKKSKGKPVDFSGVDRLLAGFSLGFAASIPLSFIHQYTMGYFVGSALLIAGIILIFIPKSRKGGEAK